jgi:hypothetical protein
MSGAPGGPAMQPKSEAEAVQQRSDETGRGILPIRDMQYRRWAG